MFSAGQMVYHKTSKHSGKVLECDGDTVYLVQANGVEMEFRSNELTATPPQGKSAIAPAIPALSRVLTINDITPEHDKVLAIIPQRTLQSVAALFERRPKSGRFRPQCSAEDQLHRRGHGGALPDHESIQR